MAKSSDDNFIIEFVRVGDSVKVSAIDPVTGREVCVAVPAKGVTQAYMMDLAAKKLRYVLNKDKDKEKEETGLY